MNKKWVNFKDVKDQLSFEAVIEHYGLVLKQFKGNELVGLCPFHEEKEPSFKINTEKKVFNCFGCHASGNVLDFVVKMEKVSIRKAALLVQEWFSMGGGEKIAYNANMSVEKGKKPSYGAKSEQIEPNKPLAFTLKLEPNHSYLKGRGVDEELAKYFEIGFCNRGLMKDRIAISIHDENNILVGYAGRWVEGELPEGEDKYKFPPDFKKSLVLYNLNRVKGISSLVVVEGFFSVVRLHQLGIPSVALMGCSLSDAQEKLLTENGCKYITLLLDGDKPGREAQEKISAIFQKKFFVRCVELPENTEPDTIEQNQLLKLLQWNKGGL
ncbi:hypothetical protein C0389_04820 [bacterium]|nr:hypothetical protein [bacterium]